MARRQRAGKNGRIAWGNSNLRAKQWSTDDKADDIDTTNFESVVQGISYDEGLTGPNVAEWSFSGSWDATANAFDDPPGIYPRDEGGPLKLYTNLTDAVFYNLILVRVLSAKVSCPVRGDVTFEASGKSQGQYTRPTGSK